MIYKVICQFISLLHRIFQVINYSYYQISLLIGVDLSAVEYGKESFNSGSMEKEMFLRSVGEHVDMVVYQHFIIL